MSSSSQRHDQYNAYLTVVDAEEQRAPSSDFIRAGLKWLLKLLAPRVHVRMAIYIFKNLRFTSSSGADKTVAMDSIIDVLARQIVAFLGGICLVIPLIMTTFLASVGARFVIVCCCVLLFSFFIGIATKASNEDLGATAAYTAVLVVFVGTSSTATSQY